MIFNLSKNLLLLIATSISIYVMSVKFSYNNNILIIVLISSCLYLFLHIADVKKRGEKQQSKNKKYLYYTLGFLTKRIILIGALSIISFVFFISGNKIFLFGILALTLLVAEIVSVYFIFKLKSLYIDLRENNFYTSENKLIIHAKHIIEIEFRHDIYYITLKNNKSYLIDTKRFYNNQQDDFSTEFKNWIKLHQIVVGEELKKQIVGI